MNRVCAVPTAVLFLCAAALGEEADRLRVQRKEVFEFTETPVLTRQEDRTTITFAVKDYCDATVAIENDGGRILRHVASGVLGANAPEPFLRNSLKQSVVWDGKNDKGEYVDDKDKVIVRVSLGLRARFERTLFWSPKRRTIEPWDGRPPQLIQVAPEGVCVYDSGYADHLRLFDHAGDYVRTIHPFPRGALEQVKGLIWREFPHDGKKWPLKWGGNESTLLTCGSLKYVEPWGPYPLVDFSGQQSVSALAYHTGTLYVIGERLNRIRPGDFGGTTLDGLKTSITKDRPRKVEVPPGARPSARMGSGSISPGTSSPTRTCSARGAPAASAAWPAST